jgi:excisionase family DNA binding protein
MSLQKRFKKSVPPAPPAYPAPISISGPRMLKMTDAAAYLGAHPNAVREMVRRREIPYVKIGHTYLIDKLDLDRYIEKNKIGVAA